MGNFTRRTALQMAGAGVLGTAFVRPAFAKDTYNFVRIDGLAEQAVGEELLKVVYDRAGINMTITAMPGRRALEEASSGRMDGETLRVFALGENMPSLKRVPTALSSLQTVAFARNDAMPAVSDKGDLNNYNSVIVTGVLHTHAITEGIENVQEVSDPSAMFRMVDRGRADLALTSYLDGLASVRLLGLDGIVNVEPALNDQPLFHYVHESNQELVPVIDAIVKEMANSGELVELRTQLETAYLDSL